MDRPGPSFFHVVGRGPARCIQSFFHGLRPGPAINFFEDGPARPGPSTFQRPGHGSARPVNFFRGWAAARPGPSNLRLHWTGPARPINFSNLSARPGPAHDICSEAHETRASYGPARGFEEPARGSAHGLTHVLPRTKKCTLTFFYIVVYNRRL